MKKTLLTLTLAIATIFASAQCTPDPQYTLAGIYPDSATGLPNALVGQSYNEVITIISPLDTSVIILGQAIPVTIQTIELTSVVGLPASFSYDCVTANCTFAGGSTSCAVLYSTIDPSAADIGLYQIFMYTTTTVDAGLFGIQTQLDTIDHYYIEVSNSVTPSWNCDGQWNCSDPGNGNGIHPSLSSCQSFCVATSVVNQFNDFTFELKDVFPNPINNNAIIQFISGSSADVVFTVFNYLGEKIEERNIVANRGVNDIEINANNYANGMYLYSINNGMQIVSKRMVVAN